MTARETAFNNSYIEELAELNRHPAPQIFCKVEDQHYIIPVSVVAISTYNCARLENNTAIDHLSSPHEITIAVIHSDDETELAKHLLDQHVASAMEHSNLLTIDQTAQLISKLEDLCNSPGAILYNVGAKLVECYGEKVPCSLLWTIINRRT